MRSRLGFGFRCQGRAAAGIRPKASKHMALSTTGVGIFSNSIPAWFLHKLYYNPPPPPPNPILTIQAPMSGSS